MTLREKIKSFFSNPKGSEPVVTPVFLFQDDETGEIIGIPVSQMEEVLARSRERVSCSYCGSDKEPKKPCKRCGAT